MILFPFGTKNLSRKANAAHECVNGDDIFIAAEMSLRIKEKQRLVGLKKKFEWAAAIEKKGKAVIEKRDRLWQLARA